MAFKRFRYTENLFYKEMKKKSQETSLTPIHKDLRVTLEQIRDKASKEAGIEITFKEASILLNMKAKKAPLINWDLAKGELFRYGYRKR